MVGFWEEQRLGADEVDWVTDMGTDESDCEDFAFDLYFLSVVKFDCIGNFLEVCCVRLCLAGIVCRQASVAGQTAASDGPVIRYQRPGPATVELRWSEADVPPVRRLLFVDGLAVDSDAIDMPRMQWAGDPCRIDLGADEHHEFPHALVSGG